MDGKLKLKQGDIVALIACSNSIMIKKSYIINNLKKVLDEIGLKVRVANMLYSENDILNKVQKEKALELMELFKDREIKAIFDVSGGDLANGLLEYIDFNIIKNNPKPFLGYSDLTVILNSIYCQSNIESYLYQIRNLVGISSKEQIFNFTRTFMFEEGNIYKFKYRWIQNDKMQGIVIGGNIRCLLKLAGTKFMPSFKNKILFLESLSGDANRIKTYLTQYKNMGVFREINGIILGSFSEMERKKYAPSIEEIIIDIIQDKKIPIAKTEDIGHGENSKCLVIGKKIFLKY